VHGVRALSPDMEGKANRPVRRRRGQRRGRARGTPLVPDFEAAGPWPLRFSMSMTTVGCIHPRSEATSAPATKATTPRKIEPATLSSADMGPALLAGTRARSRAVAELAGTRLEDGDGESRCVRRGGSCCVRRDGESSRRRQRGDRRHQAARRRVRLDRVPLTGPGMHAASRTTARTTVRAGSRSAPARLNETASEGLTTTARRRVVDVDSIGRPRDGAGDRPGQC
jgi:hypothetical protein